MPPSARSPSRRAAARIVDTLTGTDRFAVLCFDNVVERPPDLAWPERSAPVDWLVEAGREVSARKILPKE